MVYSAGQSTEAKPKRRILDLIAQPEPEAYDYVVLAVAHDAFREAGATALHGYGQAARAFFDLKSQFAGNASDLRL